MFKMRCARAGFLNLILTLAAIAQSIRPAILSRTAEEADVFQQNAPKVLTQETLEQRAKLPPSRFHPRIGQTAVPSPGPRLQVREIVSEYTVGTLRNSASRDLLEFRQLISVDGRKIQSAESARHALSLGMNSADERVRKRMLEDFAGNGLVDVATEYALILLAFTQRGQQQMTFGPAVEYRLGADDALVVPWQQTSAASGELEFHGKEVTRRALQGFLWVRKSDGLPLRISAWAEHLDAKTRIRDEATVEYVLSPHGFLTPASVVHRHYVDGQVATENLYRYEPFRLFAADTDIKFTDVPDPATLPGPIKK